MKHIKTVNSFVGDHTIIEYELFTLCDKSCSYCYNVIDTDGVRYNNSIDQVLLGLKRIMEMDNKKIIVQLIGGEVLLHKHFDEIVNFLYTNKHPDHKFTLFTHADHPVDFFRKRIDLLKKFGTAIRISCTLHFEELNRQQFLDNLQYIDENFESNLFFFTDDQYLANINFLETVFDSVKNMKLFPLVLDQSDPFTISKQLVNMNTRFEKYLSRMDTQYSIDGQLIPYNKGKYDIYKDNRLTFTGRQCKVRAYEVSRQGDITMSCFNGLETLGNIFSDSSTKLFDQCTITCNQRRCQMNLVSLDVATDEK